MTDTDTRSLNFEELELDETQTFSVGESEGASDEHIYSLAWFHALAAAPYFGAASEALRIAAQWTAAKSSTSSGDLGKLALQLSQASQLTHGMQAALSQLKSEPQEVGFGPLHPGSAHG